MKHARFWIAASLMAVAAVAACRETPGGPSQTPGRMDLVGAADSVPDSTFGTGRVAVVDLRPDSQRISPGGRGFVHAMLYNAQGQQLQNRRVRFRSSDRKVVRIEAVFGHSAELRAGRRGTAIITAISEGMRDRVLVRVADSIVPPPPPPPPPDTTGDSTSAVASQMR